MEGGPNIQEVENSTTDSNSERGSGLRFALCNPRGFLHRFVALFFMCFLGFGSYFCYDNPAALQDNMMKGLNISLTQYDMLYSIYSWPNVVLCFIGGFLIDSVFGIRLGANIYTALTLLGQLIFAAGALYDIYWLMVVARFVFGIGAESLAVAQNSYAVLWFKGKELNMVFGLQLSFARVGSAVNFLVMDYVFEWVKQFYDGGEALGIAFFIASITCVFSLLCSLILGYLDKRVETTLRRQEQINAEVVRLTDVKDFNISFWLITMICVSYYIAIFPFIGIAQKFLQSRFDMSKNDANMTISTVYLISGVVSPFLGFLIDRIGKNITWIVTAICITIFAHGLLAFSSINPYVGMSIMGISYSCLASSLWPLVSLIIPEYQLGTAYGVCQSVQNLGLAVFTIVVAMIVQQFGYTYMELFFIISLSIALLCTIVLWIITVYKGDTLNMTPGQRLLLATDASDIEKVIDEQSTSSANEDHLPNSDFQIRNRYLSRIGAPLPDHYCINSKGLTYRTLR